jgi:polyhydroxybutyrate depolymerase
LGVFLLIGSASAFTDISSSPYALAITYLSGRGVLHGYPDSSFRPEQGVTRAELTVAVMRAAGVKPGKGGSSCFTDVSASLWAAPYLCAAKAAGVVTGEGGKFSPQRPVSYAEAAKIALLGLVPSFTPLKLAPWYLSYLNYADAEGLYGAEVYRPDTPLTREVMAKLLYEALALGSSQIPPLPFPSGHLSAGCGQPPPATAPSSLTVNGRRRKVITTLPADYRSDQAYSLVIAFHGRTNPASEVRRYYDLESSEPSTDTIFVYPSGLPTKGGFNWWNPGDPTSTLRDYALFDTLLETFRKLYCLDTRRVFVVGHSLGASFVNSLACARGNVIRAVGSLAGGIMPSKCQGRVAAMLLHNPKDKLVPISLGEKARNTFLRMDGLPDASSHPDNRAPPDLGCVRYGPAAMAQPVVWCEYHQDYAYNGRYYPHNWPPDAGRTIMAFFASLP